MARRCVVCDKGTTTGNKISHSNRKSRRRWNANLQRIKINLDGTVTSRYVCTRCLKGGKVTRAI
ncbi:MAG: 50S ribosomal protein L28 [Firmicutes bacterium]|jgi:large subunit ribosomal protein L28|nr:50S ribosomal protein L28 [Bacillota bacterium]